VPEGTTDPARLLQAMVREYGAQGGEIKTGAIKGHPTAIVKVLGTMGDTPYQGIMALVVVQERAIGAFGLAAPDSWEAFSSVFTEMLFSLSFAAPE
jgi:hypothetical protein